MQGGALRPWVESEAQEKSKGPAKAGPLPAGELVQLVLLLLVAGLLVLGLLILALVLLRVLILAVLAVLIVLVLLRAAVLVLGVIPALVVLRVLIVAHDNDFLSRNDDEAEALRKAPLFRAVRTSSKRYCGQAGRDYARQVFKNFLKR